MKHVFFASEGGRPVRPVMNGDGLTRAVRPPASMVPQSSTETNTETQDTKGANDLHDTHDTKGAMVVNRGQLAGSAKTARHLLRHLR